MRKFFVSIIAVFTLIPSLALAAKPADIIKTNLLKLFESNGNATPDSMNALGLTWNFRVEVTEKLLDKKKTPDSGSVEMAMTIKNYPVSDSKHNFYFSLDVVNFRAIFDGEEKIFDHPVTFELESFNDTILYFRVTHLSDEIVSSLKAFGVDVSPLLNQWIKLDLSTEADKFGLDKKLFAPEEQSEMDARIAAWFKATFKKFGSPLLITNSQKIKILENGDRAQVVTVKFNPRWYNPIATYSLEEYKHMHPDATKREIDSQKKEIANVIKEFRDAMNHLTFQLSLNLTAGTIPGLSGKYRKTETLYNYDYKYVKNKLVTTKKIKGKRTVTIDSKINIISTLGETLEEPGSSMSTGDAWKIINPDEAVSVTSTPTTNEISS